MVPTALTGIITLLIYSCGVYNNGHTDNDGIYQSESETDLATDNEKASYYKQYFESKDKDYEDLPEEGLIFTDIEAYNTTESMDEEGYVVVEERDDYDEGYGGWGDNTEDISINVYNYGGYYGGYYGYYHSPYWYRYWHQPYWYWNIGFYWGYPFYYPHYYYYGYYGHYYNPYYWYPYKSNYISYNRGRRNLDYYPSRTVDRGRSNTSYKRNSYSRSESIRRDNSVRKNSTIKRSRGNYENTIRNRRSVPNKTIKNNRTKRSENGVQNNTIRNNNSRSRNNNNTYRPSSTNRSSNYSPRPSSSTRSSGSFRSNSGGRGSGGRN